MWYRSTIHGAMTVALALAATPTLPQPLWGQALRAPAALAKETEPNDLPATANPAANGDTVSATIGSWSDVDYYAVNLAEGAFLVLDVDARTLGSYLFPSLALFDSSGTTQLAYSYGYDVSHLEFVAAQAGRYLVRVSGQGYGGGDSYFYRLRVAVQPPAAGDPTIVFAKNLGAPRGMAAAPSGDLFAIDARGGRIERIASDGTAETWAALPSGSYLTDLALDGHGDLLVTGHTAGYEPVVWRFAHDTRARSRFTSQLQTPTAIAVGPDGDIWVADYQRLSRFDPEGVLKSTIALPYYLSEVADLAFSPAGVLYLSARGIYRIKDRVVESVVDTSASFVGLAFDRDGYLYVATEGGQPSVQLYDASTGRLTVVARTHLVGSLHLAFGRDETGALTSRLLVANGAYYYCYYGCYGPVPADTGTIVQLNPAGVRAPGWPVGVDFLVTTDTLRLGLVGAAYADTLKASIGGAGLTWSLAKDTLPPGLKLEPATGVISGVPRAAGRFAFTVRAASATGATLRTIRVAVTEPDLRVTDAIDALLGVPGMLSPELERFLDLKGNRNGRFDLGDLQAFLRAKGRLPSAPPAPAPPRENP